MSLGGRSEQVGFLRDAIGRIATDGGVSLAPAGHAGRIALGEALALDGALRGGLARGGLHEVVAAAHGDAAAASGFALALAARSAGRTAPAGAIVWIVEDAVRAEHGAPYAPGLVAHGVDPARLIVVATANTQESLWAAEEALKAGPGAVVVELWRLAAYDLTASRRLVLAAQRGATPAVLVAAGAAGRVAGLSSAATTRFEVRAAPGPVLASAGHRLPRPGRAACEVRVARIRAGPGRRPSQGQVQNQVQDQATDNDPDRFWPLVWDHAESVFRDALPLAPSAAPLDRPAAPAPGGRRAA
ncbi:hypothetical protein RHAL1_01553 [Beijerinckiaceae bacterium RH AL1]|nr:hypothetical protein RHCH11_RHCH11_01517 [Beijerinckiaceae bacterium RH CH11]VVB45099.1 hypothetical protein RHAL8_01514 [Beijerinckiaceae bacterium RH AL8]VVC54654.1 hypothetical protein RHAL1_01553 [Beijerinckiaceae bacterium RH AL1]